MLPAIIPIPIYKGLITTLDADLAPSPYFSETEIRKWTLSHFLTSYNDESIFIEGLSTISRNKKNDVGIRAFTSALRAYYDGPTGSLRRTLCRKVASNAIKRASVLQSHISAALSHEEALVEQEEVVTHQHPQPSGLPHVSDEGRQPTRESGEVPKENDTHERPYADTKPGKHARTVEDEDEADQHERAKNITDHSPFLLKDDDSEPLEEEDPVRIAQTLSHVPMNIVFEIEDYEFAAKLDSVEFGEQFTAYHNHCQSLNYDADNLADFMALSGVLYLEDRPTSLQKRYFGTKYEQLQNLVDTRVEYPTAEEVMDAVQVCRDAKDAYKKASLSRRGVKVGRLAMEETIEKAPKSALRSLLLYGAKLHQHCIPFSETDQTSRFILSTLSHVMDRPDETRIAHTASIPLTGSLLPRVYFKLEQSLHYPDVVVKYHETVDISVGEASLSASFQKDRGDLARMLMWSKRAADEIATGFEGVEDMNILFVQIIGQTCNVYLLCRVGTVSVASKVGTMKILFTLSDALSFEDDVQAWLTLDKTFNNAVNVLNDGTHRRADSTPPPCFPGLATPRSRKMKVDANKGRM
ncbi:hypothetical protein BG011_007332 [Mortierella polycephala]|uniref:Uncharacterized protein n=1 Tax=Mortierella polycephala TaxID=41804 RepID=A0A9P6U7P9_9FUNG|nr:hypothetical protein BG011_007332 [Mortierella polycephala]